MVNGFRFGSGTIDTCRLQCFAATTIDFPRLCGAACLLAALHETSIQGFSAAIDLDRVPV